MAKKFFVYTHSKADTGEVFYVGKGTCHPQGVLKTTVFSRAYTSYRRTQFWHKTAKKHGFVVDILFITDDERYALDMEIAAIKFYGRRDRGEGTLVNMTDGGDGSSGWTPTEEWKRKNSEAQKKNCKENPSRLRQIKTMSIGRQTSEVSRENYRMANLGERNPQSKLTEKIVREMRHLVATGCKQKDVAAKYGISKAHVSRIVNGVEWGHVSWR